MRFEMSADVAVLIEILKEVQEGETITYDDISAKLHRDIRKHRSVFYSASKKIVEDGYVFENVLHKGYRRLTVDDIASRCGRHSLERVHKETRRGLKNISAATRDITRIQNQDNKIKMLADMSILGMMHECSLSKKAKQIAQEVKTCNHQLSIGKTLDMFKP